tara:strand:- start:675 stop:1418 length:744 start_codon:yes stop_codon:yes gene_type:complete
MFIPPKLIGHRGVKNLCPENTLDSIKLARQLGLDWVEIDIKVSKDLIPILLHDESLNRTTNGKGLAIDFNYSEIKKFDAGIFFYKHPTKIYIPTLKEILIYCKKYNIGINIELKSNLGFEKENIQAIANLLKNNNFNNTYFFSSFDWESIILMKKYIPNAFYGILIDKFDKNHSLENVLAICNKFNFFCCGFNKNIMSLDVIKEMKKNNLITTIYSDDNLKLIDAKKFWSMGVDSIFIDDPSEFKIS